MAYSSKITGHTRELGLLRKRSSSNAAQILKRIKKTNQVFAYVIVIDFESTCWQNVKHRTQEIIEFPAVLLNTSTGTIDAEFHYYVQPQEHPTLSEFCQELTGITQEQVEQGIPLSLTLKRFSSWLQKLARERHLDFDVLSNSEYKCTFITWSDWDLGVCLQYECRRKQLRKPVELNSWIDLRATYRKFYQRRPQGLNGALKDLGIDFEGREHSGLCDARNTAKLAWRMMTDGCVLQITKTLAAPLTGATNTRVQSPLLTGQQNTTSKETSRSPSDTAIAGTVTSNPRPTIGPPQFVSRPAAIVDERRVTSGKPSPFKIHVDGSGHGLEHRKKDSALGYIGYRSAQGKTDKCEPGPAEKENDQNRLHAAVKPVTDEEKPHTDTSNRARIPTVDDSWARRNTPTVRTFTNDHSTATRHETQMAQCQSKGEFATLSLHERKTNTGAQVSKPQPSATKGPVNAIHVHAEETPKHAASTGWTIRSVTPNYSSPEMLHQRPMLPVPAANTDLTSPPVSVSDSCRPLAGGGERQTPSIGTNVKVSGLVRSANPCRQTSGREPQMGSATRMRTPLTNITNIPPSTADRKPPDSASWRTPCMTSGSHLPVGHRSSLKRTPPLCSCGRRSQRKLVQTPGPNQGRAFFCCSLGRRQATANHRASLGGSKAQGCGFFTWESSPCPRTGGGGSSSRSTGGGSSSYSTGGSVSSCSTGGVRVYRQRVLVVPPLPQPDFSTPQSDRKVPPQNKVHVGDSCSSPLLAKGR